MSGIQARTEEKKMEENSVKTEYPEEETAVSEKKKGNRFLMAVVAVVASASVSLAGFFSEPAALLDRDIRIPSAQVDVIVDDNDDEGEENEEQQKKEGFSEKVKDLILRIPFAVRSTVGMVLWGIGWVLIKLVTLLWVGVLSPVLAFLLRSLLTFLILAALTAAVLKLLFPWLRLKDIFCKKNIIFLFAVSVLMNLMDLILPLFWDKYETVRNTVLFIFFTAATAAVVIAASKRIRQLKSLLAPQTA